MLSTSLNNTRPYLSSFLPSFLPGRTPQLSGLPRSVLVDFVCLFVIEREGVVVLHLPFGSLKSPYWIGAGTDM